MEVGELRQKSHLIVSLHISEDKRIDFVELCGSELAAAHLGHCGKQVEILKNFVTESFNSLSSGLINLVQNKAGPEVKSHLVKALCLDNEAPKKVFFLCSVSPS
jgi:hypothetical protein